MTAELINSRGGIKARAVGEMRPCAGSANLKRDDGHVTTKGDWEKREKRI